MPGGLGQFSFTKHWARLVGGFYPAPKVEVELPEDLRAELLPALRPEAARLEARRQETVARIDARARWMVPLGLAPLLLILLPGVGPGVPILLAIVGALVGWGFAAGTPAKQWQKEMREGFGQTLAERLSGFAHVALPAPSPERLEALHLFGKIEDIEIADRLTGHREGRDLALSTMRIKYSSIEKPRNTQDGDRPVLNCDLVEVETTAREVPLIVGVGKTAHAVLRDTPKRVHGLTPFETGDADFDDLFYLFSADAQAARHVLTPDLRAALAALSAKHGHEPPHLVIRPRYMAILFSRLSLGAAFRSRPYWVPVDAERALAQFASDLAGRNAMINDVMALPVA